MPQARSCVLEGVIDCRAAKRIIELVKRSAACGQRPRIFSRSNMGPFETIYINETVAACDGGDEPLGHPRVFLSLGPDGKVECPYCSRLFVNRAMQRSTAGDAATPPGVSEERMSE
jgi:uncharacterized Zn-finger protein